MSTEAFTYYMHDGYSSSERAEHIAGQIGITDEDAIDALAEKIGRPFYEIALDCTIDTETGEVKILGLRST